MTRRFTVRAAGQTAGTMKHKRIVTTGAFGGWVVRAPGSSLLLGHFASRDEALEHARATLRTCGGGELVTYDDGGAAQRIAVLPADARAPAASAEAS